MTVDIEWIKLAARGGDSARLPPGPGGCEAGSRGRALAATPAESGSGDSEIRALAAGPDAEPPPRGRQPEAVGKRSSGSAGAARNFESGLDLNCRGRKCNSGPRMPAKPP